LICTGFTSLLANLSTFNLGPGNNVQADAPEFDADDDGDMLMDATGASEGISKVKMNELVSNYLKAQTLEVLVENAMEEAVVRYVDKEDTEAIKE
jgi:double-strand break repair protein MRE11